MDEKLSLFESGQAQLDEAARMLSLEPVMKICYLDMNTSLLIATTLVLE